jgi:polysaccharide export outer membrane protein
MPKGVQFKSEGVAAALALAIALGCLPALAEEVQRPALKLSPGLSQAAPPGAALPRTTMSDYRIGVEDLLEIQVFGVDQLTRTVRVNSLGMVSLPLIGAMPVGGMTAQEAESAVAVKLRDTFLQDPQVSIFIKESTNQRVTVEGAVNRPGIYPLRGQSTLLRTLALAGGQSSLSDMNHVMLFRAEPSGRRETQVHDVERIRRGEVDDPLVVNDDVIVVNRSAARTALKDSLFRDVIDTINPFSPIVR